MPAIRFSIGLLLLVCVAGCTSEKPATTKVQQTNGSTNTNSKSAEITLALNWYPEAEHGGYYAALVHNYFADEGLSVTIRPGGKGVPVIPDVASGAVHFGVDNADKMLLLRAKQADIVGVMSPIQNSPRCIMVHEKSGLKKLEEIADRGQFTLAINPGQPFLDYMTRKLKFDTIRVIPYSGGIAGFMEDPNYGQQAYSFSEPFIAEKNGGDPKCLMLSDIGFNTYTSVLLTRGELIEKQPELVEKVTRASIRGWKKYLAEPDETNEYIHKQNPEMGVDILTYGVKALLPICLPEGFEVNRLGEMSAQRWKTLVDQMSEIGQIKPGSVDPEQAFTLKFLQAH